MARSLSALVISFVILLAPTVRAAQSGRGQGPGADLIRQGVQLDLKGEYAEARKLFKQAIDMGATPQAKVPAIRATAMSYAFEND